MIAAAPPRTAKRTRVALHALAEGADAIDYTALPPSNPQMVTDRLSAVLWRIENVEQAVEHFQRLLTKLHGERAYLQRRLGIKGVER